MARVVQLLQKFWQSRELRNKLLFTAAIFAVFRLLGHIPVPAVDVTQLKNLFVQNQFLSIIDIFSGGTLSNFSIMAIGINPYITASIIMQLATLLFPKLKELSKDGESGKELINQYTRVLSVPIALVQSISVLLIMNSQKLIQTNNPLNIVVMILTLVAGSMILVWLGELVSLYGIGNGISMVIFAGIVGRIPVSVMQTLSISQTIKPSMLVLVGLLGFGVTALMVFMNEAVRKVRIQYAKRARSMPLNGDDATHLPLRLNQSGVLPIIFAISILLLPSFLARLMQQANVPQLTKIANVISTTLSPNSVPYDILYFVLVVVFTYFSTAVFFNAHDLAEELKKSGAFMPGIRPGGPTEQHLNSIVTRITLVGALFLGLIALLPTIAQRLTGITTLTLGGTGLLIVVSVVLETAKQLRSLLVSQNYEKYSN